MLFQPEHCFETRLRIRVSVAAYAYEIEDDPIMSDAEFDRLAGYVNLKRSTGRPDLDQWFRDNFCPVSGMWIRHHPEIERIGEIYGTLADRPVRETMAGDGSPGSVSRNRVVQAD